MPTYTPILANLNWKSIVSYLFLNLSDTRLIKICFLSAYLLTRKSKNYTVCVMQSDTRKTHLFSLVNATRIKTTFLCKNMQDKTDVTEGKKCYVIV